MIPAAGGETAKKKGPRAAEERPAPASRTGGSTASEQLDILRIEADATRTESPAADEEKLKKKKKSAEEEVEKKKKKKKKKSKEREDDEPADTMVDLREIPNFRHFLQRLLLVLYGYIYHT